MRIHDPLLLLPTSRVANGSSPLVCPAPKVFRYIGRRSFGEVYTLASKGIDKWRCQAQWRRDGKEIVLHCARWPAHGRPHSYRFQRTDNRGRLTSSAVRHACGRSFLSYTYQPAIRRLSRWPEVPDDTIIDEVSSPITLILKLVPNTSRIAWQHCLSRVHAGSGEALEEFVGRGARYRLKPPGFTLR